MVAVHRTLAALATLVFVCVPAIAVAASPRSYAVDVGPAGDWRAEALALTLTSDLADDRLVHDTSHVDLVVRVQLDGRAIHYELDATWPGAPPPRHGEIQLGTVNRAELAAHLRDELHALARVVHDDQINVTVAPPSATLVMIAVALAAGVLAIPFALRRAWRAPALRHAAYSVAGVGGALVAVAASGSSAAWLCTGGLAWGAFVTSTVPTVFPPVVGFGHIESDALWRVIGAWLAAVLRRSIAVIALYAPFAIVAWLVGDLVVVPIALLGVRLWVRCAIAVAALELDARLVDPTADADAWHAATRAYVVGYLRRAGLAVDEELLHRVRLVPSRGDRVVAYGGGLADSRIAIPRGMLELALAPWGRPHDYAAPRVSTLHWTEWNAGLVMPSEPGDALATMAQRKPQELADEGAAERQLLGEPPTLAGTIEPSDLDARKTYRPHDDPMWLDWDPGDDYDGTDAGDRDFLFGAVVHALGEIQRHGDRIATFALLMPKLPLRASAIGDHHAVLGGARHHLVQYLGWLLWQREDLLTARAYAPELEAASRRVLASLEDRAPGAPPGTSSPLRERITRLAAPERPTRWTRFVVASALVATVGVLGVAIAGAVRYHNVEDIHGKD